MSNKSTTILHATSDTIVDSTKKKTKSKTNSKDIGLPDEFSGDCGDDFTPLIHPDAADRQDSDQHVESLAEVAMLTLACGDVADEIHYIDEESSSQAPQCYYF